MEFEFLKERYDFELARTDRLTQAVGFPFAVLSALAGALVAMARTFSYASPVPFLVFLTLDCATFGLCLYCLARAYYGTYAYLPRLGELEQARQDLLDFFGDDQMAEEDFSENLRRRIIEAADRNAVENDAREAYLQRATLALFAALVLSGLCGIPYVADQVR